MHIILGETGHIGSALADTLINKGQQVIIISRDEKKKQQWINEGAQFSVLDILDVNALQQVFNQGERLFLLNSPAISSTDTVAQGKKTLSAILETLNRSGIKKQKHSLSYSEVLKSSTINIHHN